MGRDVHAPGFYVHIAPDECFLGVGAWRPGPGGWEQIRRAIDEEGDRWRRASRDKKFRQHFTLEGDRLKRPPRGFPADHPLIEDLKRKDFVGLGPLGEEDVLDAGFPDRVATSFAAARGMMRFLCGALKVPF